MHGIFTGTLDRAFTDFDLKGAYTNALAQFRGIDWAAIEHTTDLERLAVLDPLTVACVDFEFPPGTRFPSLPVDADPWRIGNDEKAVFELERTLDDLALGRHIFTQRILLQGKVWNARG